MYHAYTTAGPTQKGGPNERPVDHTGPIHGGETPDRTPSLVRCSIGPRASDGVGDKASDRANERRQTESAKAKRVGHYMEQEYGLSEW